ncbi:MAG: hypothetical protein LC751_03230 [Actinobacteria bacterium]|nr:hypothetical protein [Actinomycetota bacterium]MCA1739159.1 hypothetical protein [Actinomycetota bacterium]
MTRLSEAADKTFERDGIVYVSLTHPSDTSMWLNTLENKERLAQALAALEERAAILWWNREQEQ